MSNRKFHFDIGEIWNLRAGNRISLDLNNYLLQTLLMASEIVFFIYMEKFKIYPYERVSWF